LPNVRPYIYDVKLLALQGAPYIYDISRLRVNVYKACMLASVYTCLTPWSSVLLDTLTVPHPVKNFLTVYGSFITAFTTARYFFLTYARSIQSTQSQSIFLKTYSKSFHLRSVFSDSGGLAVSMLAFGTQDRGFEPGRNRRIFRTKKSTACLPSEGK
jgi:hypothetical protein